MTDSINDLHRRYHLTLVALLALITPPRLNGARGRSSVHDVAPDMVLKSRIDASGRRVFRLSVSGTLVLHLRARDRGPPEGFSLSGDWLPVCEAVVTPWRPLAGDPVRRALAPERRALPGRSPYAARKTSDAIGSERLAGPRLVRFLAECAASLGRRDAGGDRITLDLGVQGTRVRLLRIGPDAHVQVYRGNRTSLIATLSRRDLHRPARILLCVGDRWAADPLRQLRAYAGRVDPADLVAFCRFGL